VAPTDRLTKAILDHAGPSTPLLDAGRAELDRQIKAGASGATIGVTAANGNAGVEVTAGGTFDTTHTTISAQGWGAWMRETGWAVAAKIGIGPRRGGSK
jgi:hypothetical protein